jgi:peptidoglycan/xylan/chitin deacetylase (PgdA/CDA1 family)
MLVLGWHNVEGTPCFPSAPGEGLRGFRDQVEWLARWADVVPLRESLRALAAGHRLAPRAVAITFDDGYRDNLELAVPELERLGLPATFFLVPGLLDRRAEPWWEAVAWAVTEATAPEATIAGERVVLGDPSERRAVRRRAEEHLKRRDRDAREAALAEMVEALRPRPRDDLKELFLDWPGARELAGRGFEIGSHSSHHAILSEEPPQAQMADLAESRAALEQGLGVPVTSVAYPNGGRLDYDGATLAAAQAAGYESGITTRKGLTGRRTPRFEVRRVVVYPERGTRVLRTLADVAWKRARRALGGARVPSTAVAATGPR